VTLNQRETKNEGERKKGEDRKRESDGRMRPLRNEPAAIHGNRNNYAKTERNGASRAKGKKEDVPWNGAQKDQTELRWWWRWHAKKARMGKRAGCKATPRPLFRIPLFLPYFLPPNGNNKLFLSPCSLSSTFSSRIAVRFRTGHGRSVSRWRRPLFHCPFCR